MSKIKRFRMKPGVTLDDIRARCKVYPIDEVDLDCDYSDWLRDDTRNYFCIPIMDFETYIYVGLPENLEDWDDAAHVLVLEDATGQPYTPFYGKNYGKDAEDDPYLERVIKSYNRKMSELSFLEAIDEFQQLCR